MDDLVIEFLEDNISPELMKVLMSCFKQFDNFIDNFDSEVYVNRLIDYEDRSTEGMKTDIINLIKTDLLSIFKAHGIKLNGNVSFSMMCEMLDALHTLQSDESLEGLTSILEENVNSITTLSEIFEYFTGINSLQFMDRLDEVDDRLIVKIKSMVNLQIDDDTFSVKPEVIEFFKNVILYNNHYQVTNIIVASELVINGLRPGMNKDLYLPFIKDVFNQLMEKTKIEDLMFNIYCSIGLIEDGLLNPIENSKIIFEMIFPNTIFGNKENDLILKYHTNIKSFTDSTH